MDVLEEIIMIRLIREKQMDRIIKKIEGQKW